MTEKTERDDMPKWATKTARNEYRLPLMGRLFCRLLWHSWRGVTNKHGVFKWLVCQRCGTRRNLMSEEIYGVGG